jgi:tetratricopeptide (TPR) repeat protein
MKVRVLITCSVLFFSQAFAASVAPLKSDGQTHYDRGLGLLKAGQPQAAIDAMKKAIDQDPKNAEYHFALGLLYAARMSELSLLRAALLIRPAREALVIAVELNPKHVRANMALAELLLEVPSVTGGARAQAKEILNRLQSMDPASASALEARMQGPDADPAWIEKLLLQAVEMKPGEASFRLRLTRFYVDQRAYPKAVTHGQEYLRMPKHWTDFSSDTNYAHLWLTVAYHALEDQPNFRLHAQAVDINHMPPRFRQEAERVYKAAGINSIRIAPAGKP